MKKIYAFTLESDEYPSRKFRSNLRLMAFLLYDAIYKYDEEYNCPLIINSNIKFNCINEGHYYDYSLEYDGFDDKYINYEPLLLTDKTFVITVDDTKISEKEICTLMRQSMYLAKIDYKYTLNSITYLSKNKEDERHRRKAVYRLRDTILKNDEMEKNDVLVKKRTLRSLSNIGRKIGIL